MKARRFFKSILPFFVLKEILKEMNQPNKTLETADLYLSSYLRSYDILPHKKRQEGTKTFWIFFETEELKQRIYTYLHDEWLKKFIRAIRDTKYQIYNPSELII